jgi:uncharacterized RDD family membrane protein YckC
MPQPGWYPDPASDSNIRFWDGRSWTDRVQPKSVPPPPAAGAVAPPAPPAAPPRNGGYVGPQQPQPARPQPPQPLIDPYGPATQGPPLVGPYGGYAPAPPVRAAAAGKVGPDGQPLAGWWRRVGGYLIDFVIVGIPAFIAAFIAATVITANGGVLIDEAQFQRVFDALAAGDSSLAPQELFDILTPGFWTVILVAGAVWFIANLINGVYLISRSGQTVGDRAVGVRKVMAGRTVPTFGVALARWLIPNVLFALVGNFVPFGFILTYGDYLWPLWDRKAQTLHDKMVRTYVERADLSGPPVRRP